MLRIKIMLLISTIVILNFKCLAQNDYEQKVVKEGVSVQWYHMNDSIHFELEAPTLGWIAIGFNTHQKIDETYLLIGHVLKEEAKVVEHYTLEPGDYKSLASLGLVPSLTNISGSESAGKTMLKFSRHINKSNIYQRSLAQGSEYIMQIAYSRVDDFQHHSIMRTTINVKL